MPLAYRLINGGNESQPGMEKLMKTGSFCKNQKRPYWTIESVFVRKPYLDIIETNLLSSFTGLS
jgi:hypothetical protein